MARARATGPTEGLEIEGRDHILVRQFRLLVSDGPDRGVRYETGRERVVLGTHKSADLLLHDATMSRFHCEIALVDGQPILTDLGSRNGSAVDGVPVLRAPLRDGATLLLGRTRLRFEIGDEKVKVPLSERERFGLLVGRSHAMRAAFARLEHAAGSDTPVLLLGETGTGKDLAAESIHQASARHEGPFVIVDCGALAPSLIESELFGHERGAFTGADRDRTGAFEAAHGGTLFLDEIAELGLELQPKLLRVLERREVQRIGSSRRRRIDIRVIAATNRSLRTEVNARRFRSELYYRIAVLEVVLPPLRERLDDLPTLVESLLASFGEVAPGARAFLRSPAFLEELRRHRWAGNVRELRNYLECCLATQDGAQLRPPSGRHEELGVDGSAPLRLAHERWLRSYLEDLLRRHGDNATSAARAAGIARSQLYRLLARCGLR